MATVSTKNGSLRGPRIMVRATNWLGDAIMSLPAIREIKRACPDAFLAVVARPSVADVYASEIAVDRVIPYPKPHGFAERLRFAAGLRREQFDTAILLQNAFDAGLIAWWARIPRRIGYNRDGRRVLLTTAVPVPKPGEIPRHERYYYLELLRRAGLIHAMPQSDCIRLDGIGPTREAGLVRLRALGITTPAIGISPGAAYGSAKRWAPEQFFETAARIAASTERHAFLVFGSAQERSLCETVAGLLRGEGLETLNLAGETTLREFMDIAAICRLFLTNDSGAMHVASASGVPTVAVFGATDDAGTGPTGALARVVREPVSCAPCLLRECPIDHRCMTRVTAERVAAVALELLKEESSPTWTREGKS